MVDRMSKGHSQLGINTAGEEQGKAVVDQLQGSEVHAADARLPIHRLFPLGLQHVLVMYASTIAVPFIFAAGLDLPTKALVHLVAADLLLCGIGTILQSLRVWKVGAGMPLVVGASFNLIAPMILIGNAYSMQVLYGSIFASGIAVFLIAPYFAKLMRFFPSLVIGVVILLIGINLMPAALGLVFGYDPNSANYADPTHLVLAGIAIFSVIVLYRLLPPLFSQLSLLLAMIIGMIIAYFLGELNLSGITEGAVVQFPHLFYWGLPEFKVLPILSLVLLWIVMMVETAGQIAAVGNVIDKKVGRSHLIGALRVDGIASALGGVFQSFGYVTFTQNVGVVSLTGVRSKYVTVMAGVILIFLSLFPIIGRVVASIPDAVLGGVTLAMFATVAIIGIQILSRVDFDRIGNVVIAAISLGLGTIPVLVPHAYDDFPLQFKMFMNNGILVGALLAIMLNIVFNILGSKDGHNAYEEDQMMFQENE